MLRDRWNEIPAAAFCSTDTFGECGGLALPEHCGNRSVHLRAMSYRVWCGMTRVIPPYFSAFPAALVLAAGAACWPAASLAQSVPVVAAAEAAPSVTGDTIRLTDEQRMKILDNNTADSAAAARGELTGSERVGHGIHGEVGIMIGSHGTRGVYGTADIPLGDNAGATISFESSRYGYQR
jgi:hypothetical protein